MIVLLVVIGVTAIAILGRKYDNTALPTVLALALCCCLSLGIYFYASVFSRAGELIFAAVCGVLLSAGVYVLTNALCLRHAVLKDSAAHTAGLRKPLVEFVESDEEECEEKTCEDSEKISEGLAGVGEKEELPKLWEEEAPASEAERCAFNEALDEALFADTEAAMEAKEAEKAAVETEEEAVQVPFAISSEAVRSEKQENVEPEPMSDEAKEEYEPLVQSKAFMFSAPEKAEEICEDITVEEEASDIPLLMLGEDIDVVEINKEPLTIEEEEIDIPPLSLKEIAEDYTFDEETDFLPPLEEVTAAASGEEAEETAKLFETEPKAVESTGTCAEEEAGTAEFNAAGSFRFIGEEPEAAESIMAEAAESVEEEPEVIELKTAVLFEYVGKEDEAVEPETVQYTEAAVNTAANDIPKDSEPFDEAFEAIELDMSESVAYKEEAESEKPVIEPAEKPAFEPVPAPDDFKRRKDEAMAEVKGLVAKRQYSDALTSLFALLNSGFALSEDEKHQLLIIMKLLKEKGI